MEELNKRNKQTIKTPATKQLPLPRLFFSLLRISVWVNISRVTHENPASELTYHADDLQAVHILNL